MAIDPTAPVTPAHPALSPVGAPADAAAALLARARAALADSASLLGEIVGETSGGAEALATGSGSGKPAATGPTPPLETDQPAAIMRAAVREAAAKAAPRQAGLAPLMADLAVVADRADTPPPVRQAARALIGAALPTQAPVTATVLREAVQRSGAFLETDLARIVAATTAPQTGPSLALIQRLEPARDMKAALLVFRAVVAAWVDETALAEVAEPATDPEAARLKAQPPPAASARQPPPSAYDRFALSHEAGEEGARGPTLARSAPPPVSAPSPQAASPAATLLSAQIAAASPAGVGSARLVSAAEARAEDGGPTRLSTRDEDQPDAQRAATPSGLTPPAAPRADRAPPAAPILMVGLIEEDPPLEPLPEAPESGAAPDRAPVRSEAARTPPPPFAGGPTTPQAAQPSTLLLDASPAEVARRLLKDVGGALARQELLQIASLPDARSPSDQPVESRSARVVMDLPFQTPQGAPSPSSRSAATAAAAAAAAPTAVARSSALGARGSRWMSSRWGPCISRWRLQASRPASACGPSAPRPWRGCGRGRRR